MSEGRESVSGNGILCFRKTSIYRKRFRQTPNRYLGNVNSYRE